MIGSSKNIIIARIFKFKLFAFVLFLLIILFVIKYKIIKIAIKSRYQPKENEFKKLKNLFTKYENLLIVIRALVNIAQRQGLCEVAAISEPSTFGDRELSYGKN